MALFLRSVKHFLEVLDELNRLNVEFVSFREQIDTGGPLGRAIVVIIGAIAELERNLIIERVRAGMRRAKLEGQHIGRKPLVLDRAAILRRRIRSQPLRAIRSGAHHAVAGGIQRDGVTAGHLDLHIPVCIEGVVAGMRGRVQGEAKGFCGDDLTDRSHEMAVWGELAPGVQPLKLGNGTVYRRDGRRQLDSTIHAGVFPYSCAGSAYRTRSEYPVAHGDEEGSGEAEDPVEATGESEKGRRSDRRGLFDSAAPIK